MTAVPVVSATLTTRTVREALSTDGDWFPADDIVWAASAANERRERLTVDPVFVVVDAAPDLTCRECGGDCFVDAVSEYDIVHPSATGPNGEPLALCPSCGGTGVSPVYAATWQWVEVSCTPEPFHAHRERRQVVEWRGTKVEPLPVVDSDPRNHPDMNVAANTEWSTYVPRPDRSAWEQLPERVDAGRCVLRLSGWEHLDTPPTEMVCQGCDNGNVTDEYGVDQCPRCSSVLRVPLSVPDGAVTWIELA